MIKLAVDFRQAFDRDIVIDIIGYRKHGHNEGDEPSFTQPKLYEHIKNHPGTRSMYARKLIEDGVIEESEVKTIEKEIQENYKAAFSSAKKEELKPSDKPFRGVWHNLGNAYSHKSIETGVNAETLSQIAEKTSEIPSDFHFHPKLRGIIDRRLESFQKTDKIDWAMGETLALGSLLLEGTPVRLSGQDSGRGTFSHRHSIWYDIKTSESRIPLNFITDGQEHFCVYDSPLSEASVLGFEYGYSLAEPRMLIIWEAQFGDFTNGAQVMIDQFITGSESRWQRSSGIVLLLPHGNEGQGPDHSSAHLERFLQLCGDDNIQVCNATTPAQYFHLLRRQMKRNFRKPLIIMAPKSLLRHSLVKSDIEELVSGSFIEVMDDPTPRENADKLILCSGKIFYELFTRREESLRDDIALVRIEQLYPFPDDRFNDILNKYKNVKSVYWVQEETQNRGAWSYVAPILERTCNNKFMGYTGRATSASPAAGSMRRHKFEQNAILDQVFAINKK